MGRGEVVAQLEKDVGKIVVLNLIRGQTNELVTMLNVGAYMMDNMKEVFLAGYKESVNGIKDYHGINPSKHRISLSVEDHCDYCIDCSAWYFEKEGFSVELTEYQKKLWEAKNK